MGELGVSGSVIAGLEMLPPSQLLTRALPWGLLVHLGWDGFGISLSEGTGWTPSTQVLSVTVSEVFPLLSFLPLLLCSPFLTASPDILLFSSSLTLWAGLLVS